MVPLVPMTGSLIDLFTGIGPAAAGGFGAEGFLAAGELDVALGSLLDALVTGLAEPVGDAGLVSTAGAEEADGGGGDVGELLAGEKTAAEPDVPAVQPVTAVVTTPTATRPRPRRE